MKLKEKGTIHKKWTIKKFASQKDFDNSNPYSVSEVNRNVLLNEGINELWTILCSAGGTKFDNNNANIGVGDDNTAADATQTGLQAVSNKAYKAMDDGYPTYGSDQKATFRATFESGDANYDWKEFTVANGGDNTADNLNRLVSDQGTKVSGQVWQVTLEISLS